MIKIQIIQNPLKLIGKMVKILLSKKFRKNKKIRKLVKLELLKKRKKFLVSSISSQILILEMKIWINLRMMKLIKWMKNVRSIVKFQIISNKKLFLIHCNTF